MKICIVSNSHHTTDVRLYYKMGLSLKKLGKVYLICTSGVRNSTINPYQLVVDTESQWNALRLLYEEAKRIRPDIVICVEPLTVFVGLALRRKLGTRVVFDVHEFFPDAFAERFHPPFSWLAKYLYLGLERWLQSRVDGTIGVNDEILDQIVSQRERDHAVTLPNYPVKNVWDYDCEIPPEISTICEMDFDLIYIGGLTADRGLFKLLKSVKLLKHSFPTLKTLIVGRFFSPSVETEFNAYINRHNLNAIIYYQPWIPAEKIGLLLKRSKVGLWLFNPRNRRLRKAVPLKVLEYFAAGLPVVSVNTPLMRDLVEKNRAGACCEYQSAAIAKEVGGILNQSEEEYGRMSRRASALIENQYNWEAVEPRLLGLIKSLASR
jgi:glycosyltransferase involved in cell wall biosynthesis